MKNKCICGMVQCFECECFIRCLKKYAGKDGKNGTNGTNGKSAYQIAVDNGFIGTEIEWLESLHGQDGANGIDGTNGVDGQDGITPTIGANGNWFIGTTDTGLPSRGEQGEQGFDGIDGRNAYEIAVDEGFVGTVEEWLESLNGNDGLTPYVGTNDNWWIGNTDTGVLARGYVTPRFHHANLSAVNSQYQASFAPLAGVNRLTLRLQRTNTTTIVASLYALRGDTILVDLKRATQYDALGVEGFTLDGGTVVQSFQTIDTQIYANSNEFQKTYIRVRDPIDTTLWSLYEISIFVSANGARTDIWIMPIYEMQSITIW